MSTSQITIGVLLIASIVLAILYGKSCYKNKTAQANIVALTDTLDTFRNKNGEQVSRIASFEADKLSDIRKIKSSDSTIQWLQAVIKDNKNASSVLVVSNETKVNNTSPTTIVKTDTVDNYLYPTYESKVSMGKWVTGRTLASRDSTHLDLVIYNEYDVIFKRESGQLNAYVVNHNPYTSTKTQRAASVTQPRTKLFGIGPSAGVTWYNGKPQPYIGLGVHFNVIRF